MVQKETSGETSATETLTTTSIVTDHKHCSKHSSDSEIESTDSDCSDATYMPPVVQIKQEPDTSTRARGRPHKRRGTTRLMFSQRGWDSQFKRPKRQPTGRPRGRPRKHVSLHTSPSNAYYCRINTNKEIKRPRGWPKGKPRKEKILSTSTDHREVTSRPCASTIKRPRGRPRKGFQPRFCSTPTSSELLRDVKQELVDENWGRSQMMSSHQETGSLTSRLHSAQYVPTSYKPVCNLPECNDPKNSEENRFAKIDSCHSQLTDSDPGEAVTSLSRNVGRVHWIYRKRKMPIPSIPVSLKLNRNELDELVRNNRPDDAFLSPHRREPPDSASWSSEDSGLNYLNPQTTVNNLYNVPTTHVASGVVNSIQSNPQCVQSQNMYGDTSMQPTSDTGIIQSLPEGYCFSSSLNSKQTSVQNILYSSPINQNNTSLYSQVTIKDINQHMARRPSSIRNNYEPIPAMKESGQTRSQEPIGRDEASSQEDPCETVLRSMSKHRLLYLLKRCTEQPSHSLHESALLGQRRSKEGDSLEEDSLEEKPSSPIVERFCPLNISLQ